MAEESARFVFQALQPVFAGILSASDDPRRMTQLLKNAHSTVTGNSLVREHLHACLEFVLYPFSFLLDSICATRRQPGTPGRSVPAMATPVAAEHALRCFHAILVCCEIQRPSQVCAIAGRLAELTHLAVGDNFNEETLLLALQSTQAAFRPSPTLRRLVCLAMKESDQLSISLGYLFHGLLGKLEADAFTETSKVHGAALKAAEHVVHALSVSPDSLAFFVPGVVSKTCTYLLRTSLDNRHTPKGPAAAAAALLQAVLVSTMDPDTLPSQCSRRDAHAEGPEGTGSKSASVGQQALRRIHAAFASPAPDEHTSAGRGDAGTPPPSQALAQTGRRGADGSYGRAAPAASQRRQEELGDAAPAEGASGAARFLVERNVEWVESTQHTLHRVLQTVLQRLSAHPSASVRAATTGFLTALLRRTQAALSQDLRSLLVRSLLLFAADGAEGVAGPARALLFQPAVGAQPALPIDEETGAVWDPAALQACCERELPALQREFDAAILRPQKELQDAAARLASAVRACSPSHIVELVALQPVGRSAAVASMQHALEVDGSVATLWLRTQPVNLGGLDVAASLASEGEDNRPESSASRDQAGHGGTAAVSLQERINPARGPLGLSTGQLDVAAGSGAPGPTAVGHPSAAPEPPLSSAASSRSSLPGACMPAAGPHPQAACDDAARGADGGQVGIGRGQPASPSARNHTASSSALSASRPNLRAARAALSCMPAALKHVHEEAVFRAIVAVPRACGYVCMGAALEAGTSRPVGVLAILHHVNELLAQSTEAKSKRRHRQPATLLPGDPADAACVLQHQASLLHFLSHFLSGCGEALAAAADKPAGSCLSGWKSAERPGKAPSGRATWSHDREAGPAAATPAASAARGGPLDLFPDFCTEMGNDPSLDDVLLGDEQAGMPEAVEEDFHRGSAAAEGHDGRGDGGVVTAVAGELLGAMKAGVQSCEAAALRLARDGRNASAATTGPENPLKAAHVVHAHALATLVAALAAALPGVLRASDALLRVLLLPLLQLAVHGAAPVAAQAAAAVQGLCACLAVPSLSQLVLQHSDYLVDGLVKQLRSPEDHPRAPALLAALFHQASLPASLLSALSEPASSAIQRLSVFHRHARPQLSLPFLRMLAPMTEAAAALGRQLDGGSARHLTQLLARSRTQVEEHERALQAAAAAAVEAGEPGGAAGAYFRARADADECGRDRLHRVLLQGRERDEVEQARAQAYAAAEIAAAAAGAAAPLLLSADVDTAAAARRVIRGALSALHPLTAALDRYTDELSDLLSEDLPPLPGPPARLLPTVHGTWGFILPGLRSASAPTTEGTLSLLDHLSHLAGDFLARRFKTDALPHVVRLIRGSAHLRRTAAKVEVHEEPLAPDAATALVASAQQEHALGAGARGQEELAEAPGTVRRRQAAALRFVADTCGGDTGAQMVRTCTQALACACVALLASLPSPDISSGASAALSALARVDADVVWLELASAAGGRLPDGACPAPPGMPACASGTGLVQRHKQLEGPGRQELQVLWHLLRKVEALPVPWHREVQLARRAAASVDHESEADTPAV